ncbi:alpha/beta fold hydrolase [Pararhodobacter sp.]|uniref:alpha/beta fold hydrolase n=1 Tax=Pararhodobacter sp. TaxID=2127056 RepID=UPI002AFF3D3D|nr:alpha/beta hydrolase [Pararhodobacter sp.]
MRILSLLILLLTTSAARADCVVLLHGLSRTENSMRMLEEVLQFHHYRVVNHTYPSQDAPVSALVDYVGQSAAQCGTERMHFVTHSLGGILVRAWLANAHPENLGRVVMLAPPNHGSEIVDTFAESDLTRRAMIWLNGPAVPQLGTDEGSALHQLPPSVDFELGIIAGDVPINPLGPIVIDGPNDGTVSVASTRIDGMRDHIVIGATHTLIMLNPVAIAEVLEFLRNGVFDHGITLLGALRKLSNP